MAQEPRHPLGRVRLSAILLAVALLAVSAVFILPRVWPRPSPDGAPPTPTNAPPPPPPPAAEGRDHRRPLPPAPRPHHPRAGRLRSAAGVALCPRGRDPPGAVRQRQLQSAYG